MRHNSATFTLPPSASLKRSSHFSTNFVRCFTASVASQGIRDSRCRVCQGCPWTPSALCQGCPWIKVSRIYQDCTLSAIYPVYSQVGVSKKISAYSTCVNDHDRLTLEHGEWGAFSRRQAGSTF